MELRALGQGQVRPPGEGGGREGDGGGEAGEMKEPPPQAGEPREGRRWGARGEPCMQAVARLGCKAASFSGPGGEGGCTSRGGPLAEKNAEGRTPFAPASRGRAFLGGAAGEAGNGVCRRLVPLEEACA